MIMLNVYTFFNSKFEREMKLSYNPRASESVRCLSQIGRVYVLCIYRHHTLSLICPHNSINKTLYAYTCIHVYVIYAYMQSKY